MVFSTRYITFLLLVILSIAVAAYRINMQSTIIQSPNDQREYRSLKLDNGLKVILVSDRNADKAAASLAVGVGSGDDPKGRQGLAHFLEHMLFLGTEPFPDSGEYQNYISKHGGSHNAFTAHDVTNYFFEIDNNDLEGALDRFAPFFISPTFDAKYVKREKNAVNAEYTSKSKDDGRRIFSAGKQAMNPAHPYAQFATGSLKTLEDRPDSMIRDELIAFYQQHYSANEMTFALIGNYDLDILEQWTQEKFSAIPEREVITKVKRPSLYLRDQLPLDLQIEPIKELRQLRLTFPVPESLSAYHYKPLQIINHLLGHEGEGSLLALFKKRGWANLISQYTAYLSWPFPH
jgi:insulysin